MQGHEMLGILAISLDKRMDAAGMPCAERVSGTTDFTVPIAIEGELAEQIAVLLPDSQNGVFEIFEHQPPRFRPLCLESRQLPTLVGASEFVMHMTSDYEDTPASVRWSYEGGIVGAARVRFLSMTDLNVFCYEDQTRDLELSLVRAAMSEQNMLRWSGRLTQASSLRVRAIERLHAYAQDLQLRTGANWKGELPGKALRAYLSETLGEEASEVSRILGRLSSDGIIQRTRVLGTSSTAKKRTKSVDGFRINDPTRLSVLARRILFFDREAAGNEVEKLLARGELFASSRLAHDLARVHPGDFRLLWLAALASARLGAYEHAQRLLDQIGVSEPKNGWPISTFQDFEQALEPRSEDVAPPNRLPARYWREEKTVETCRKLVVDCFALQARIAKDQSDLPKAQMAYQSIAAWSDDNGYCAINAATLAALIGDNQAAEKWAQTALQAVTPERDWWSAATAAEALVLLDRSQEAAILLSKYIGSNPRVLQERVSDVSTTRHQLEKLAMVRPGAKRVISQIPKPLILVLTAHMVPQDSDKQTILRWTSLLKDALESKLDGLNVTHLYSGLAQGGDLMSISILREMFTMLKFHPILPRSLERYRPTSIGTPGSYWDERAREALAFASSPQVLFEEHESLEEDSVDFELANEFMSGLALLHADRMTADCEFVAIAGGGPSGTGGTKHCLARWSTLGLEPKTIDCPWRPQTSDSAFKVPPFAPLPVRAWRSPNNRLGKLEEIFVPSSFDGAGKFTSQFKGDGRSSLLDLDFGGPQVPPEIDPRLLPERMTLVSHRLAAFIRLRINPSDGAADHLRGYTRMDESMVYQVFPE